MKHILRIDEDFENTYMQPHNTPLYGVCQTTTENGFVVRVELHKVKESQGYKDLRQYMIDNDFSGVIVNRIGVVYKLPTATYYHANPTNMETPNTIYKKALGAVRAALKNEYEYIKVANMRPTILVTETNSALWTGLEMADITDL